MSITSSLKALSLIALFGMAVLSTQAFSSQSQAEQPAARPSQDITAHGTQAATVPETPAQACRPKVRVAYAGYGEAERLTCPTPRQN